MTTQEQLKNMYSKAEKLYNNFHPPIKNKSTKINTCLQ